MRIEVASQKSDTTKAKGDLLENLAKDLLSEVVGVCETA